MKTTYKATVEVEKTIKIKKPKYELNKPYILETHSRLENISFYSSYWCNEIHEWKYSYNLNASDYYLAESLIKTITLK